MTVHGCVHHYIFVLWMYYFCISIVIFRRNRDIVPVYRHLSDHDINDKCEGFPYDIIRFGS